MSKESPAKIAFAGVFLVGALVFAASSIFDIDVGAKLSSLWSDSPEQMSFGNGMDGENEIPLPKRNRQERSTAQSSESQDEPLNLDAGGHLEELGEELMEDRLWEEGILGSRPEGVRSGKAVLEALSEIENWSPMEGGYNPTKLFIYLRHPKLWVRLSAFAFAIKAKALDEKQETKMARLITLKSRENPFQVKRFLLRYERKDPELYGQLLERLIAKDLSDDKSGTPLLEEESEDAESENAS